MADQQQQTLNIAGSVIAVLVVGLLWFITWCLVFYNVPAENATNLSQIIGMIGIQVGIVIGWFFGSSSNNKKLVDTISTQANTAAAAQAVIPPAPTIHLAPNEQATVKADK